MRYYKVNNLLAFGVADYKGLDRKKIIKGSQVYDFEKNLCLLASSEDVEHDDLIDLTEIEYSTEKELISTNYPIEPEDEIKKLKEDQDLIKMALDDLILGGAL